ncbi:MAG: hypothetical protein H3Z51_03630 [archaeon]|nr:hypothetical protein [archaeon]
MIQVKEYPIDERKAQELTRRFNEVFTNHTGYVLRSPDLWIELYSRSSEAHLLVAEDESHTLGYVIVTLQHYYGCKLASISEICIWEESKKVSRILLDRVEILAQKMGVDLIASWEVGDKIINEVFEEKGFIPAGRSVFSIGIISLDFLRSFLELSGKILTKKKRVREMNIVVDLSERKLPSYSGIFTIKFSQDGGISICEERCTNPDACIRTNIVTFSEIVLKIRNPYKALTLREIRVFPFWKTFKVIRLLKSLSICPKWHTPLGDYF